MHYMILQPIAQNIEETDQFINESRVGMKAAYNLQFVILSKKETSI